VRKTRSTFGLLLVCATAEKVGGDNNERKKRELTAFWRKE